MPFDDGLTPRNRGLVLLVGCSFLVLVNLLVFRMHGQALAMLFPFAGAIAPVGTVLLVTGASVERLRDTSRPTLAHVTLGLALVGLLTGFVMNTMLA